MQYQWDDDGSLVLKARLPAETGAPVLKALEAAVEELHGRFDPLQVLAEMKTQEGGDVSAETSVDKPTPAMKRADALGVMAEGFLKHGPEAMKGDRCQIVVTRRANLVALSCQEILGDNEMKNRMQEQTDIRRQCTGWSLNGG